MSSSFGGCLSPIELIYTNAIIIMQGRVAFDEIETRIHNQVFFQQYQAQGIKIVIVYLQA